MNFNGFIKSKSEYILAIVIFLVLAFAYCAPVFEGKVISSHDVTTAKGQQGEINEYLKKENRTILWTNSMFSGMPTYLISIGTSGKVNLFHRLSSFIRFGLPKYSVDIIFLYMLGFFLLALAFKVNIWIAVIGSIAFAFSSYNIIYIEAGHINKTFAMAMMAPILAGLIFAQRGKFLLGSLIFCCALGIQIAFNHLQITYYTMILVVCWGAFNLAYSILEKSIKRYILLVSIFIIAAGLSILPNLVHILPTYEYLEESSRGGSELSVEGNNEKSSGLDKSYAFAWSSSPKETFTLLIPNFRGGSTVSSLSENSYLFKALRNNNATKAQAKQYCSQVYTYWGVKSSTAGPFYYGAIIVFLFIFGMIALASKHKWWILTISVLAIMWSWGENFMAFSSFSFDYIPLFNKFRVPENWLVVSSLTFPILAILLLDKIVKRDYEKKLIQKQLLTAFYITGGLLVLILLFSGGFNYNSKLDAAYARMPEWFVDAIKKDRARLLRLDTFRSLIYISLAFGSIWLFVQKKLKLQYFVGVLAFFILIDLWGIDRRYLNSDSFEKPKKAKEIKATLANQQIANDTDPNFRVFNLSDPFRESRTSFFHKSLGGYHAAKIARYDDIIQNHLGKNNLKVINMLNTKYVIVQNDEGQEIAQRNPQALGNAWFINNIKWVDGAKDENEALYHFNPRFEATIDKKFKSYFEGKTLPDSAIGKVKLLTYHPEKLEYRVNSVEGGFVVFSEIYYNSNKGWQAYIDDEKVEHLRVNYILRGMYIPKGEHDITFKFEPAIIKKAKLISTSGSLIVLALIVLVIILSFAEVKKSKTAVH